MRRPAGLALLISAATAHGNNGQIPLSNARFTNDASAFPPAGNAIDGLWGLRDDFFPNEYASSSSNQNPQLIVDLPNRSYVDKVTIYPKYGVCDSACEDDDHYTGMTVTVGQTVCTPLQGLTRDDVQAAYTLGLEWDCNGAQGSDIVVNNDNYIHIAEISADGYYYISLNSAQFSDGQYYNSNGVAHAPIFAIDGVLPVAGQDDSQFAHSHDNVNPQFIVDLPSSDAHVKNVVLYPRYSVQGINSGFYDQYQSLNVTVGGHMCSSALQLDALTVYNNALNGLTWNCPNAAVGDRVLVANTNWIQLSEIEVIGFIDYNAQPCTCANGYACVGINCPVGGVEYCVICDPGYYLHNNQCYPNQCNCPFGTAATGLQCLSNGQDLCVACPTGFHVEGGYCVQNVCSCNNGVPVSGIDCVEHQKLACESCDLGFQLNSANPSVPFCEQNNCLCDNGLPEHGCNGVNEYRCNPNYCSAGYYYNPATQRCNFQMCVCEHGMPNKDCTSATEISCKIDQTAVLPEDHILCDPGFHEVAIGNGKFDCQLNQCICDNGEGKSGTGCGVHGEASCGRCYPGYALKEILVNGATVIDIATGEEKLFCTDVTCPCLRGTGFQDGQCLMDTGDETYKGEDDCQSCDIGYELSEVAHRKIQFALPPINGLQSYKQWYQDQYASFPADLFNNDFPVRDPRNQGSGKNNWDRHKCVPQKCGCDFGRPQSMSTQFVDQNWNVVDEDDAVLQIPGNSQCRLHGNVVQGVPMQYHGCYDCADYYHMNWDDAVCDDYNCKTGHAIADNVGICQENVCTCFNPADSSEVFGVPRSMSSPWVADFAQDWFATVNAYSQNSTENDFVDFVDSSFVSWDDDAVLGQGIQLGWIRKFYNAVDKTFTDAQYVTIVNADLVSLNYTGSNNALLLALQQEYNTPNPTWAQALRHVLSYEQYDFGKISDVIAGCSANGANECSSCDTFDYTKFDATNTFCVFKQCNCPNGVALGDYDCFRDDVQCEQNSCDQFYHSEEHYDPVYNKYWYSCEPNVCRCSNGIPQPSNECDEHLQNECAECDAHWHIVTDRPELAPLSNGQYYDYWSADCSVNLCVCANGLPVDAGECDIDGGNQCKICDLGFRLVNGSCVANECTCENGEPRVTGVTRDVCRVHQRNECQTCDPFYKLDDNVAAPSCIKKQCKCSHGTPVDFCEDETIEDCKICDDYYHFQTITPINGAQIYSKECVPNVCVCALGKRAWSGDQDAEKLVWENAGNPVTEKCRVHGADQCRKCSGAHLRLVLPAGICATNVCDCEYGSPKVDTECHDNDSNSCASCNKYYHMANKNDKWYSEENQQEFTSDGDDCKLNECVCEYSYSNGTTINVGTADQYCNVDGGNECEACIKINQVDPVCPDGSVGPSVNNTEYFTLSKWVTSSEEKQRCVPKECECDNGTPTKPYVDGGYCSSNGGQMCESCDAGYHLSACLGVCEANHCTCSNGQARITDMTSNQCSEDGKEECQSCDDGYELVEDSSSPNYLQCVPRICTCLVTENTGHAYTDYDVSNYEYYRIQDHSLKFYAANTESVIRGLQGGNCLNKYKRTMPITFFNATSDKWEIEMIEDYYGCNNCGAWDDLGLTQADKTFVDELEDHFGDDYNNLPEIVKYYAAFTKWITVDPTVEVASPYYATCRLNQCFCYEGQAKSDFACPAHWEADASTIALWKSKMATEDYTYYVDTALNYGIVDQNNYALSLTNWEELFEQIHNRCLLSFYFSDPIEVMTKELNIYQDAAWKAANIPTKFSEDYVNIQIANLEGLIYEYGTSCTEGHYCDLCYRPGAVLDDNLHCQNIFCPCTGGTGKSDGSCNEQDWGHDVCESCNFGYYMQKVTTQELVLDDLIAPVYETVASMVYYDIYSAFGYKTGVKYQYQADRCVPNQCFCSAMQYRGTYVSGTALTDNIAGSPVPDGECYADGVQSCGECNLGYSKVLREVVDHVDPNTGETTQLDIYECQPNRCQCNNGQGRWTGIFHDENTICPIDGSHSCAVCDEFYILTYQADNVFTCEPKICLCDSSTFGEWGTGVARAEGFCNKHLAQDCASCDFGYHIHRTHPWRNSENKLMGSAFDLGNGLYHHPCLENKCTCRNGFGKQDGACWLDGGEDCDYCREFWHPEWDFFGNGVTRHTCQKNKCICDIGIPVPDEICRIHGETQCLSCNDFGYFVDPNQGDRCMPKECACENGKGIHDGTCMDVRMNRCRECDEGFELQFVEGQNTEFHELLTGSDIDTVNYPAETCVYTPKCQCFNGLAADNCAIHNQLKCKICNEGYYLSASNECVASNTCTCSCGTPAVGAECDVDGAEKCASCDCGYTLTNNKCFETKCTCVNGIAVQDGTCHDASHEKCVFCNPGFELIYTENPLPAADHYPYKSTCEPTGALPVPTTVAPVQAAGCPVGQTENNKGNCVDVKALFVRQPSNNPKQPGPLYVQNNPASDPSTLYCMGLVDGSAEYGELKPYADCNDPNVLNSFFYSGKTNTIFGKKNYNGENTKGRACLKQFTDADGNPRLETEKCTSTPAAGFSAEYGFNKKKGSSRWNLDVSQWYISDSKDDANKVYLRVAYQDQIVNSVP